MTTIDTATVPAKMSKITKLMAALDALSKINSEVQPTISLGHIEQTAKDASQLIMDLLGMTDKSRGEQIYEHWLKGQQPDDEYSLTACVLFLKRWTPETFPASAEGQIHFGRALIEMAIDTMTAEIKRRGHDEKAGDDGL